MIKTLDSLMVDRGEGVIYLDKNMKILSENKIATEILSQSDGLLKRMGALVLSDKQANTTLKKHIAAEGAVGSLSIFIPRISSEPPYRLSLADFEDYSLCSSKDTPKALAFISAPDERLSFPEWVFAHHYKLTRAELALARALFKDAALREYADNRGVKISTVRWTLDNIFSKTYTHSQRELKSLALRHAL